MKKIWINLELYFKRYDFYNFWDFSGFFSLFFWLNFYLTTLKIDIKKCKKHAGPARVRRGTQGHVAEPHGPAQRAYVARYIYYIYLLYTYIYMVLCPSLYGKGHTRIDRRVL